MGLKIGMVTPYNVRCGIATYSQQLMMALAEQDVEIHVTRLPRFGIKTQEIMVDVAERISKDVDLIHVQHEYGLYKEHSNVFYGALRQHGKPIITTMHAVGNWPVDALVATISKKVIVHNNFCAKRFSYPTVIIPHGTKLVPPLPHDTAKKEIGVDPSIPIVGYLGFITEYKGLEVLFEAMVKVKAGVLVGGGYHTDEETAYMVNLKAGSQKLLGDRVKWLGYIPEEQLQKVYNAIDVFVYPSRWATESGALLTALSHGKAVIASTLAPFKEKEKEGALITFRGKKDLTRKIKKLLTDSEARHKLEKNAWKYAEKTSWENVAAQHIQIYKSVL
jgi:glycosyltransferase involved in cell wall biosynthesis